MKYDIFQCPSCGEKLGKSLKCCKKEFKGLNFLDEKAYKEDPLFNYYEKEYEKYYDLKKEAQNSKEKFKDITRFLKKIKFNSVLDLGCGSGSFIANFKNLPKKQLYGTDISSPALSYAKKHFKGITFFRADCMKLPIKNKSVDVVTFTDLIEYVDNPRKLLKEIRRVSNYLILKVPLEDNVILNLYKKVQKTDWKKMMGHIHFWNEKIFQKTHARRGLSGD